MPRMTGVGRRASQAKFFKKIVELIVPIPRRLHQAVEWSQQFEILCSSVSSKYGDQVACLSVNGGDEGSAAIRHLRFVLNEVDASIVAEHVAAADVVSGSTDAVYLHWAAYVADDQGSDTRLLGSAMGKHFPGHLGSNTIMTFLERLPVG
ncbi:hypothetical protein OUZ56_032041 [Daphnia magna]|uniref:Uncharacterized protein n=1 Tax=Daphnia magna TaxID=35525 RepID=A0ABQ9ZW38_9CRUS|nr:hypothetical protein OUZ56_032041 [Daphnia magna]